MKRNIFQKVAIAVVAVVATCGFFINAQEETMSDLLLENIEALADDDEAEGSGNTVYCYSSSDYKKGSTYYDCGTCSRESNAVGTGARGQCTVQ